MLTNPIDSPYPQNFLKQGRLRMVLVISVD
jgi:hypothetical protein